MNSQKVFFKDALQKAVIGLRDSGLSPDKALIIRDIYGRIHVAIDSSRDEAKDREAALLSSLALLGAYAEAGERQVLFREDFFDPGSIFSDPAIQEMWLPEIGSPIRLLDRQIVGQDWILPHNPGSIPRLVFYGFKGGVGRTTAITILAYHLASKGRRVLLIDLDLESPGLSSLLLPMDNRADFGLVDWFVEDGVGQGEAVLPRLVAASPVGQHTQGAIRVAAASGRDTGEDHYLSKLARVYADINGEGRVERFADRVRRLVEELERQEQPDVVLIDSRAGLHDLAAISIVGLSTHTYLFAAGSVQSWQGYRLLFSHWRAYPKMLAKIRDRLVMVHAMFPETEQEARANQFLEDSYTLFSETLYESIEPGPKPDEEIFNFDLKDESAPHYPARIRWNNSLQEFSPLLHSRHILGDEMIGATFGDFLSRVDNDLSEVNKDG